MNRFRYTSEEMETLIKPPVRALMERGNVTYEEWTNTAMNSYERARVLPFLTLEAMKEVGKFYLHHCSFKDFPTTYDEVALHIILPCILQKLDEVQDLSKPAPKTTGVHGKGGLRPPGLSGTNPGTDEPRRDGKETTL